MYPSIESQQQALDDQDRLIYEKLRFSETIDGWLLVDEVIELYRRVLTSTRRPAAFCEIGTWMGKSLSILAKAAIDRGDAVVYGIDPFTGIGDPISSEEYQRVRSTLKQTQYDQCASNLERVGVMKAVRLLPYTSIEARKKFHEQSIDGLFIDGDHTFESVMQDISLWSPLIAPGGWLALHDVGAVHVDGPRRAMEELQKNADEWIDWRMVGEMAICVRR